MHGNLDEADLALIHALQVSPRSTWAELGPILGLTPTALAQRWDRLFAAGLAWVTACPRLESTPGVVNAFVDVVCDAAKRDAISAALAHDPRIAGIEHTAHGRDLLLTIYAPSIDQLSSMLLDELPALDGLHSARAHVTTQTHFEGSKWTLDSLDQCQLDAVARLRGRQPAGPPPLAVPALLQPLVAEIARNGRASAAEIADAIDRPPSTVRRQLATLVRSGALLFRCDVAQRATRWPVPIVFWCRVQTAYRGEIVEALRDEPCARVCMSLTGPTNLLVYLWTGPSADVMRAQERLERLFDGHGEIVEVSLTLRTVKRMGWLLRPDGTATGEVVPIGLRA